MCVRSLPLSFSLSHTHTPTRTPGCRDKHGLYPVHYGAMGGVVGVLAWVDTKPLPEDTDATTWTEVTDAAQRNCAHIAAMCGRVAVIQRVLAGTGGVAACRAVDALGRSSLHYATVSGAEDSVVLVEALAGAGVGCDVRDGEGKSPLALARDIGNGEVIARLSACVAPPPAPLVTGVAAEGESVRVSWALPPPLFPFLPPILGTQLHFTHHMPGMPLPCGPSVSSNDTRVDVTATQSAVPGSPLQFVHVAPAPPAVPDATSLVRLRCCNAAGWGPFSPFIPLPV